MVGWLELICGSMYCGKSEELIRRLKRVKIAGQKYQLFKPSLDDRYGVNHVATHDNNELKITIEEILDLHFSGGINHREVLMEELIKQLPGSMEATIVANSNMILDLVKNDTLVIGIDEIQFFDSNIIIVVDELIKQGKRVITAGLDMYCSGIPFNSVDILACKAKYIDKLHAVCIDCGKDALYSFNINDYESNIKNVINVGSVGKYIALCENCRDIRLKNWKT